MKKACSAAKDSNSFNLFTLVYYTMMVLCVTFFGANYSEAAKHKKRGHLKPAQLANSPLIGTTIGPYDRSPPTSLVVDFESGKILESTNGKVPIYPASLTKIMTAYIVFEAIEAGKISMNDRIPVSFKASHVIPLNLGLKAGHNVKVEDAIKGAIIHSANDACIALAEKIAGSEEKFAAMMTKRAQSLGMKDTSFMNASGFHHPKQKTTPIDLAKLAIAIKRDFPQYYSLFKQNSFEYNGRTIRGHNRVTQNYAGVEFGKTGFTNPAGLNLVTVAKRGDKRLIGVVTGSKNAAYRNQKMMSMLDKHFGIVTNIKAQPVKASNLKLVKHKITKKVKTKRVKRVSA